MLFFVFSEMARGSIGRERMLSGVVGISSHQPPPVGHQEDLNNELLAVSFQDSVADFTPSRKVFDITM